MECDMKFRKLWLNINGVDRLVVCDPEKDTLADLLRRLGLTGVRMACGTGVCGACSVILDGKVIHSCTKKVKKIRDYARIITIEGIGTAMNPHPLQRAMIYHGAVQCGICIPGFIISAYALLQENASPTREEVRHWFQIHHNYCRCTGYKQIVDAVMDAAAVMRGDKSVDDITYKPEGHYFGSHLPRPDSLGKVTGLVDYGEDTSLKMPEGTLHMAIVQPRVTYHAEILKIHTEEAEKMPGVVRVITGKDVIGNNLLNVYPYYYRNKILTATRELICTKKIKRYGDVIALVVADTRDHAREAARKVTMEYRQLPEYLGRNDALMPDAEQVHTGYPNDYYDLDVVKGERADEVIDDSYCSVEASMYTQRQPHLNLEGNIILGYFDEDGQLTLQSKSQYLYGNQRSIIKGVGISEDEGIRIVQHGAVGASFGWSCDATDHALVAIACTLTHRPVSLVMSWEEHNHFAGKRQPFMGNFRMSCDKDGILTGLEYDAGENQGAYVEFDGCYNAFVRMGVPYKIPNIAGVVHVFSSNSNTCTAWRGYGAPEAGFFTETLMDMLAHKMNMDPFEFRYKNLIRDNDLDSTGGTYENANQLTKLMDMARPYYYEVKERAEKASTPEFMRAVGVSNGIFFPTIGSRDRAQTTIEIREDNRFYVHNTYHAMGQGANISCLVATLDALKELDIKPEDIQIDIDDTKYCPDSGISAQSRSFVMNTGAIYEAAKLLKDAMRKEDGTYRTYQEMTAEKIPTSYTANFSQPGRQTQKRDTFHGQHEVPPRPVFSVNICEVGVEAATGKTKVLSYHCYADCGKIGSYLGANGQAYGGIAQAIGYALSEDYEDMKKAKNPVSSGLPSIEDVPDDIAVTWQEDLDNPGNPFGSNGLSECFACGQSAAITNGIYNATGVRIYDQPAYPSKVKAGLDAIREGKEPEVPEPYYLGPDDMYDMIDYFDSNPIPENWIQERGKILAEANKETGK